MKKKYRRGDIGPDGQYFIQYSRYKRIDGSLAEYEFWGTLEDVLKLRYRAQKDYQKKRELVLARCSKYEKENAEKIAERKRKYYLKNRERINKRQRKYERIKYYSSPEFRLAAKVRGRVNEFIRKHKITKKERTCKYLGCTFRFFKDYIEAKFTNEMNWERLLRGEIHIDHIRPISSFNLFNEEELMEAFHYTNCQPLWAIDNLKKKDKWNPETLPLT
jgi:hypothetical protein